MCSYSSQKSEADSKGDFFPACKHVGVSRNLCQWEKVGEDVLTPAVSHLSKRSLIVTYDITPYLREGENDLLIWLGQGWYKTTTFGAAYEGPLVKQNWMC